MDKEEKRRWANMATENTWLMDLFHRMKKKATDAMLSAPFDDDLTRLENQIRYRTIDAIEVQIRNAQTAPEDEEA